MDRKSIVQIKYLGYQKRIKKIYEELKTQIKEHEGFVPRVYKDSLGKRI